MTESIIIMFATALCSGGLTWLFTVKYTRKQAEADAMKSIQEVYQCLIDDLIKDREYWKEEFGKKVEDLEKTTRENSKVITLMTPMLCGLHNCQQRRKFDISTSNQ